MMRARAATLMFVMTAWAAAQGHGGMPQPAEHGNLIQTEAEEKRETLEHKFTLVFRVLHQSPGALRIAASDHAQAKALIALARERFSAARQEIVAANLDVADGLLNDVLRMFGRAARMVPDPVQEQDARRVRFTRMLDEIQAFRGSQSLSMQRRPRDGEMAHNPNRDRTGELIREAQELAEGERFAEAIGVLEKVRDAIVSEAGALLASKTLVYELKFSSPEAEFEYEIARYGSYEDLIPIAVAKYRPGSEAVRDIAELAEKSGRARSLARELAAHGDYPAGIKTLQDATGLLEKAVERAGLTLPR